MAADEKIKVCHIISGDLWAGAEVQAYTLLVSLKKEAQLNVSAIVLNEGRLVEKLRDAGLEVAVIDESKYNFLQILSLIKKALKGKDTDICHTHRYKENILGALLKRSGVVRYLVQTVHGLGEPFQGVKLVKAKIYSALNQYFTNRYFDRVQAVSDDIREKLRFKIGASRLVTIHNCIDSSSVKITRSADEVKRELAIEGNQAVIGSVGRMVEVKRYDVFLRAARIIIDKMPDAIFILVGDGPLKSSLEEQARQLGIEKQVLFLGFREDVTDVMNCFDVYLVTSQHEGIPMSLLEAMALQKAVVSTAVGGIREIIEDGVSGLLVVPRSGDELASVCVDLLAKRDLRRKLGAGACTRVREEFSVEIQTERVLALYQRTIGRK